MSPTALSSDEDRNSLHSFDLGDEKEEPSLPEKKRK